MTHSAAFQMIAEMKEFATFNPAEQRYIRRSLDVGRNEGNPIERWSRNRAEQASICAQARLYGTVLPAARNAVPDDIELGGAVEFVALLLNMTEFDLAGGKLGTFAAYRFLYERLLGGVARPWLPCAFAAAAALPSLHPSERKALLGSMAESEVAAPGWSIREPAFTPAWVEKVPVAVS